MLDPLIPHEWQIRDVEILRGAKPFGMSQQLWESAPEGLNTGDDQ